MISTRQAAHDSFADAARRAPGRLRIGWSTKSVSLGVKPDPVHVAAVHETARLLSDLGHDVREIDPHYPDPTAAFIPQFFGGIRAEADQVEHYDRLESRTRQTYRLGSWVTPKVLDWARRQSEQVALKVNRVFAEVDVLLTPATAHRPAPVGRLDGVGPIGASLRSMPSIAYAALWNVAGNPAASVPCGIAADGLPVAVQLVGRTDDEATLFSLSAPARGCSSLAARRALIAGFGLGGSVLAQTGAVGYGLLLVTPRARVRRVLRRRRTRARSPAARSWSPGPRPGSVRPRAIAVARRGATVLLVARRTAELERVLRSSSTRAARRRASLRPDGRRGRRSCWSSRCWPSTARSTTWSTTPAARSGARCT